MRILVTGAGGFTGLNLVKKLLFEGHDVYGLTKRVIEFSHPKFHLIIKDLFDINNIVSAGPDLRKYKLELPTTTTYNYLSNMWYTNKLY